MSPVPRTCVSGLGALSDSALDDRLAHLAARGATSAELTSGILVEVLRRSDPESAEAIVAGLRKGGMRGHEELVAVAPQAVALPALDLDDEFSEDGRDQPRFVEGDDQSVASLALSIEGARADDGIFDPAADSFAAREVSFGVEAWAAGETIDAEVSFRRAALGAAWAGRPFRDPYALAGLAAALRGDGPSAISLLATAATLEERTYRTDSVAVDLTARVSPWPGLTIVTTALAPATCWALVGLLVRSGRRDEALEVASSYAADLYVRDVDPVGLAFLSRAIDDDDRLGHVLADVTARSTMEGKSPKLAAKVAAYLLSTRPGALDVYLAHQAIDQDAAHREEIVLALVGHGRLDRAREVAEATGSSTDALVPAAIEARDWELLRAACLRMKTDATRNLVLAQLTRDENWPLFVELWPRLGVRTLELDQAFSLAAFIERHGGRVSDFPLVQSVIQPAIAEREAQAREAQEELGLARAAEDAARRSAELAAMIEARAWAQLVEAVGPDTPPGEVSGALTALLDAGKAEEVRAIVGALGGWRALAPSAAVTFARALMDDGLADASIELLTRLANDGVREAKRARVEALLRLGRRAQARRELAALVLETPDDPAVIALSRSLAAAPRELRRETIPIEVRDRVWQRDGGMCTNCSSRVRLEFDHVVPLAMGGSNTERNIQLLCADCNRVKGATLG